MPIVDHDIGRLGRFAIIVVMVPLSANALVSNTQLGGGEGAEMRQKDGGDAPVLFHDQYYAISEQMYSIRDERDEGKYLSYFHFCFRSSPVWYYLTGSFLQLIPKEICR